MFVRPQHQMGAKPARKEGYEQNKAYHIKGLFKPTASKTDVVSLGAVRRPAVTIILPGGSEGLAALARGVKSHWCPWAWQIACNFGGSFPETAVVCRALTI